jgi:hypothetical protein
MTRISLDTIADGSTLVDPNPRKTRSHDDIPVFSVLKETNTDTNGRQYNSNMMDSRITGPKDSKNTVLEVTTPRVQTIRHAVDRSHNEGDFRLGQVDRPVKRDGLPTIPVGCNGPVYCPLGKAMRNVILNYDPEAAILAATHEQNTHGGVQFVDPMEKTSMMGAANSLPVDGPEGKSLHNAQGLEYTVDIPNSTDMVAHAANQSAVPFGGESGFL